MGKIDELIKELCPDGVEWVELCDIVKNITPPTKIKIDNYLDHGIYPIIDQSKKQISGYTNEIEYTLPENKYILYGDHTLSVKYYNGRFAQGADGLKILICTDSLTKFIYYCICAYNIQSSEYKRHWTQAKRIQIPLLPLSIQQQIVEILDTFTDSISNLQEELELREKQMEYYRENIMTSENVWKTLGEIGTLIRGKRFCHRDAVENGIPCIHYGELYTYYGVSTDVTKSFVRNDLAAKLRFAKKGDVVIVGAGENDIDIGVGVAYYGDRQVAVHDACYTLSNHNMNPKFISYWLRTNTYHQQIRQYVSSGKICSISTEGLAKARIPVPSLSRQQEIVDILDTFESMIANIKEEIELRKKQYEYYRGKLLTFD